MSICLKLLGEEPLAIQLAKEFVDTVNNIRVSINDLKTKYEEFKNKYKLIDSCKKKSGEYRINFDLKMVKDAAGKIAIDTKVAPNEQLIASLNCGNSIMQPRLEVGLYLLDLLKNDLVGFQNKGLLSSMVNLLNRANNAQSIVKLPTDQIVKVTKEIQEILKTTDELIKYLHDNLIVDQTKK